MNDFKEELIVLVIIIFLLIAGASIFKSQFLNPDYLFSQGSAFFQGLFNFIANSNTVALFYTILFFFAIFFLTVSSYSVVRIFEIRKKEHAYLHHEIAEYARFQAEVEQKIEQDKKEGSENRSEE